jgi:hypothetical protein
MEVEIVVKVVEVVGAGVVGAIFNAYQEDITNALHFRASKSNDYLLGTWDCTWDTLAPAPRSPIHDRVDITRVSGNLVKGKGRTEKFGDRDLDGRVADLAVSFSYTGRREQRNLPGAIVLKKVSNSEMSGAWAQYFATGDVISGTTAWRRV